MRSHHLLILLAAALICAINPAAADDYAKTKVVDTGISIYNWSDSTAKYISVVGDTIGHTIEYNPVDAAPSISIGLDGSVTLTAATNRKINACQCVEDEITYCEVGGYNEPTICWCVISPNDWCDYCYQVSGSATGVRDINATGGCQ